MCGIAGVVVARGRPGPDEAAIRRLASAIEHRGPDGTGRFVEDGVLLCHARLAILDPSPAGAQPMRLGSSTLVHNGEVYNYLELRRELEGAGRVFQTGTDTEVILAAIDAWGPDAVQRFAGMWAFAHCDPSRQRLILSRDRLGIKPLYYRIVPGGIAFASEVQALVAMGAVGPDDHWRPTPNPRAIRDFIVRGLTDHSTDTFIQGIWALPAGHQLVFDRDRLNVTPYWQAPPQSSDASPASPATAAGDAALVAEFRETFESSVALHLRSDVPIGTCLSGGLDSASVLGTASHLLHGLSGASNPSTARHEAVPRHAFHVNFPGAGIDELAFAELSARASGAALTTVQPQAASLLAGVVRTLRVQGEPFISTSVIAQRDLMDAIGRSGVTVLLDGQGADELLGGYQNYAATRAAGRLRAGDVAGARRLRIGSAGSPGLTATSAAGQLRAVLPDGVVDWARQVALRRQGVKLGPELRAVGPERHPAAVGGTHLGRLLWRDLTSTSLPGLLRYEDRNSMASGIEARVPFLDHRLVELAARLPDRLKVGPEGSKLVLRRAMAGIVPREILDRRGKLGFATPEREWMRQSAPEIAAVLRDGQLVRRGMVRLGERGIDAITTSLGWRLLVTEAWLRLLWPADSPGAGQMEWDLAIGGATAVPPARRAAHAAITGIAPSGRSRTE